MDDAAHASFVNRIQEYMEKALHEAKVHTSWINPNVSYDASVRDFIAMVLDRNENAEFLAKLQEFIGPVARAGLLNAISQVVLKMAAPGVPDFYQGTEMLDFSLVDPDNRRPVDYASRKTKLAELDERERSDRLSLIDDLFSQPENGLLKQYVTSRGLQFRRSREQLFANGHYIPLQAAGSRQKHTIAFAREHGGDVVIAVTGRFYSTLISQTGSAIGSAAWAGSTLVLPKNVSGTGFCDALTGRKIRSSAWRAGRTTLALEDVFAHLPMALLYRQELYRQEH
jgi:(1->4)-alpha-D-glucan 1-alpha-D-glucosylmutase